MLSAYLNSTQLEHRKAFGQFFTPELVARLMVKWVNKTAPSTILDPAFGLGVFLKETVALRTDDQFLFTATEIDPNIFKYALKSYDSSNKNILNADYLSANLGRFDAIVCNPPYMRFQKFVNRHNVLPILEQQTGHKLIGYTNLASVFLVKSLSELNRNGRLAYILPYEFFNTGYGRDIKRQLIEKGLLKHIITFSNEKDIFPEVTTTICILLCRNDDRVEDVKLSEISSLSDLLRFSDFDEMPFTSLPPSSLPPSKKWTPIFDSTRIPRLQTPHFVSLATYGGFMRGIATGANDFFALSADDIDKHRLSKKSVVKCITKSSQISSPIFDDPSFTRLVEANKKVFCLNLKEQLSQNEIEYVKSGEKLSYHTRYLTRNRSQWYQIERRSPAPLLAAVFNRGRLKLIRNFTDSINFTCYHSFFPNMFGESLVDKLFIYLYSSIGQEIIKYNKRSYGDSLDKYEPGDLNEVLCPNPQQFEAISDTETRHVLCIAKSDPVRAIELSDILIGRIVRIPDRGVSEPHNNV